MVEAGGGVGGDAGSVAARTTRLTVSGRARRHPMKAQRRGEDLNISERAPESMLEHSTQADRGNARDSRNGNRRGGWAVYHRKVECVA